MNYTLHIRFSAIEGAVIRILGLIERRGFSLGKCSISEADHGARSMEVAVTSERPGDLLKRQLERLHDVQHVELKTTTLIKKNPGIRPINRRV